MDTSLSMFILLVSATLALGQRPFFAGTKPIGFPETPNITDTLGDRFGEVDGTTQRLPVEAHGDLALIDRLSKLPVDKQPFWFINWQAYEANRENPQTYPQRPSSFNDPIPITNNGNSGTPVSNSGAANSNSVTATSNSGAANSNSGAANSNSVTAVTNSGGANSNSATTTLNSATTSSGIPPANRFGEPDTSVKPVATTNGDKKAESKPISEKKPTVSNDKKESSTKKPVSSSVSANSTPEPEKKTEEAPLLPIPIEPASTLIDGLKLEEDASAEKKLRFFRRPEVK